MMLLNGMLLNGMLSAGNLMLIIFALVFSLKVFKDKTRKDYLRPWKYIFIALIFFFFFEVIDIIDIFVQIGLIAWWDLSSIVYMLNMLKGIARIGIVVSFLFGLILEDKHEQVEEEQIVQKMLKTKRKRKEIV